VGIPPPPPPPPVPTPMYLNKDFKTPLNNYYIKIIPKMRCSHVLLDAGACVSYLATPRKRALIPHPSVCLQNIGKQMKCVCVLFVVADVTGLQMYYKG
jgi:hypothetical protein